MGCGLSAGARPWQSLTTNHWPLATQSINTAFSLANATARWLMLSFSAGSSSPKVWSWPSGMKIGS